MNARCDKILYQPYRRVVGSTVGSAADMADYGPFLLFFCSVRFGSVRGIFLDVLTEQTAFILTRGAGLFACIQ